MIIFMVISVITVVISVDFGDFGESCYRASIMVTRNTEFVSAVFRAGCVRIYERLGHRELIISPIDFYSNPHCI